MSVASEIAARGSDPGAVAPEIRRVALDLHDLLLQVGAADGIYVVVEDVPAGTRLSAGRCNGNDTWSLAPGELDGLTLILPFTRIEPFLLSVRILAPDPCGYDYASTTARFELIVCPDRELTLALPARAATGGPAWPRLLPVPASLQSDSTTTEEPRLTAARAEWQVEEEIRFARTRAYWDSTEEERWLGRESELRAQLSAELAEAEAQWARREAGRVAAIEAHWAARLAASKARWRAHEEQHRCVLLPAPAVDAQRTTLRRFIARLAPPVAFACTFAAIWMS
jgi:hypothetical protein